MGLSILEYMVLDFGMFFGLGFSQFRALVLGFMFRVLVFRVLRFRVLGFSMLALGFRV